MHDSQPSDRDRLAIRKTTSELLAAVNASDVSGCIAVWAEDGVLMPPNHASVEGRAAIAEYFRRLFSARKFRFTFKSSQIDVAGDLAVERLTYTAVSSSIDETTERTDVGKGVHVYRRQADGAWRLSHDIWNTNR